MEEKFIISIGILAGLLGFSAVTIAVIFSRMKHYRLMCIINEMKILLAEDLIRSNRDIIKELEERLNESYGFKEEA